MDPETSAPSNQRTTPPPQFDEEGANVHLRPAAPEPYTKENFPSVGETPIPNVSPMTAHLHLALLRRFCDLYNAVEAEATDAEGKALLMQQFLVCAEFRYLHYLAILDEISWNSADAHEFRETMPLPPWDVAIIFHAHCLSPFRFYCDINRRGIGIWQKGITFPLERLYALINSGIWSDAESEQMWNTSTSYQLWEADPSSSDSRLQLQDIEFACPWCNDISKIPLKHFTQVHTTKTGTFKCSSCDREYDADRLSAKYFKDDCLENIKHHSGWVVKGAISGIADPKPEETANVDFHYIFNMILEPFQQPRRRTHLAIYINSDNDPTWVNLDKFFKKTIEDFKGPRILRALSRTTLFDALRISYMGIMWRDLSIDLVAASLRQREFSKKIISPELSAIDTPKALFKATTRYHKFLMLLKRGSTKKGTSLVPTLDIDLCWHTHQLYPTSYRQWCIQHLELAINHDDTVGSAVLDKGLEETIRAWSKAYRESYIPESPEGQASESSQRRRSSLGSLFSRKKEPKAEDAAAPISTQDKPYMRMYPYWLKLPFGWNFPAGCSSGIAGQGGWSASVDKSSLVASTCGGERSQCAGCTGGGCTLMWGDRDSMR